MMTEAFLRGLESKPVYDYNHAPLGTVAGTALDPRTQDPTELIITLHPQARDRFHAERETLTVPFDFVFGIRRDEVTLSRSLPELMDLLAKNAPPVRRIEGPIVKR